MRLIHPGGVLLLLCAACVVIVPSCYRIEISLDRFGAGAQGGDAAQVGEAGSASGGETHDVGSTCDSDEECETGLRCLRASGDADPLGAPAKGLCSVECGSDSDCQGFGLGLVCATFSEAPLSGGEVAVDAKRWCLEGCKLGAPADSAKCHGRTEMACRPFATVGAETCAGTCEGGSLCYRGQCRATACGPRCNANADCPPDRRCNAETGLCDAEPESVVAVGAPCGVGASQPACGAGVCFEDEQDPKNVQQICTQSCTLGSSCAEGGGACVQAQLPVYAAGDIGYCAQTCNCDSDCSDEAYACYAWQNPEFVSRFHSAGYCQLRRAEPGLTKCSPGGAASR